MVKQFYLFDLLLTLHIRVLAVILFVEPPRARLYLMCLKEGVVFVSNNFHEIKTIENIQLIVSIQLPLNIENKILTKRNQKPNIKQDHTNKNNVTPKDFF